MLSFIKRNLMLYFSNRTLVFFSMLASLISFVLYLVFLKSNMQQEWQQVPGTTNLLNPWLVGGTMSITGLTATGSALGQIVRDRESRCIDDIELTDLNVWQIQSGYLIAAVVIGVINQLVAFFVMSGYFQIVDGTKIDWQQFGWIVVVAILGSLVWTAFNLIFYSLIQKVQSISTISSIISTAAGFFAGVYIPISVLPDVAQTIMKLTPAPYISALYRQLIMQTALHDSFKNLPAKTLTTFKLDMGIDLKLNASVINNMDMILILIGFMALFIVIIILIKFFQRRGVNLVEG